jgi:CRISPR type III-B/RAMP module RAMP protein Cmr1
MAIATTIQVRCKPLTPVWTGDADGKGERTRETGLIGSLRWWYEAILRGCGFYACDPSSGTCVYEDDRRLAGICLACQLFGCTGYSRRFRLEVEGGGGTGELLPVRLKNPGVANHRGWRVPKFLTKPFILKILPLYPKSMDTQGLSLTLGLIERFGAFGAKTSHGQGAVRFGDLASPPAVAEWIAGLKHLPAKAAAGSQGNVPDLRDFVGATIDFTPQPQNQQQKQPKWWDKLPVHTGDLGGFGLSSTSTWAPTAPVIRAMLRAELRAKAISPDDRHRLMGTIQRWGDPRPEIKDGKPRDRTKASDVFVTHAYRVDDAWRMRIFGFIPCGDGVADQRMRTLLGDPEKLRSRIVSALSLQTGDVVVTPFPGTVEQLLEGNA